MGDRLLILCGLLLFMSLVTFPVWQGIAVHSSTGEPEVKRPAGEKSCVAPRDYMRKAHVELLMNWRDAKVREHQRRYTAYDGKVYAVSLTGTCLTQCHGSRDKFCDRCHAYAGVSTPSCWNCHTSPSAEPGGSAAAEVVR